MLWYTDCMSHIYLRSFVYTFCSIFFLVTAIPSTYALYTDTKFVSNETKIALEYLYENSIITGNPDGSFKPFSSLNRAELVTIILRMQAGATSTAYTQPCFADVPSTAWYADAVCSAKAFGIITGYTDTVSPSGLLYFKPENPVSYVEAVKMLASTRAMLIKYTNNQLWYADYLAAAEERSLTLSIDNIHSLLTREQAAQLTAKFYAYYTNEFDWYTRQLNTVQSQSSVSYSSSSTSSISSLIQSSPRSSSSVYSTSSNSSSSSVEAIYDTLPLETIRSNFLPLGDIGPAVASLSVFSEHQPIFVDEFVFTLTSPVNSLNSLKVYDDSGVFIGNATRKSNTQYVLATKDSTVRIPKKISRTFYTRPSLKQYDAGGISGENLQIGSVLLQVEGEWDSSTQTITDTSVYPTYTTAAAILTNITANGREEDLFLAGTSVRIGSFMFAGRTFHNRAESRITDLIITPTMGSDVMLTNVVLRDTVGGTETPCTVTTVITCASIPANVGSIDDGPRTLTLYADVTSSSPNAYLQLQLLNPGSPVSTGSVYWTDGITPFTWVHASTPVATGTTYKR
jgi:S-layer homology domain